MFADLICALNWELVYLPGISVDYVASLRFIFLICRLKSYSGNDVLESLPVKKSEKLCDSKYKIHFHIPNH